MIFNLVHTLSHIKLKLNALFTVSYAFVASTILSFPLFLSSDNNLQCICVTSGRQETLLEVFSFRAWWVLIHRSKPMPKCIQRKCVCDISMCLPFSHLWAEEQPKTSQWTSLRRTVRGYIKVSPALFHLLADSWTHNSWSQVKQHSFLGGSV